MEDSGNSFPSGTPRNPLPPVTGGDAEGTPPMILSLLLLGRQHALIFIYAYHFLFPFRIIFIFLSRIIFLLHKNAFKFCGVFCTHKKLFVENLFILILMYKIMAFGTDYRVIFISSTFKVLVLLFRNIHHFCWKTQCVLLFVGFSKVMFYSFCLLPSDYLKDFLFVFGLSEI